MTLQIIVSAKCGGVYDFAQSFLGQLKEFDAKIVVLNKQNVKQWTVNNDSIYIQLSAYGYQKRGMPFWLLFEVFKKRKNIKRLGIYFHELYAFGYPWTSSFWCSPFQRFITLSFARLADFWITNREDSAQWLKRFAQNKPNRVIPVFSNMGELKAPIYKKSKNIVVFGSPQLREKTYNIVGKELFMWAKKNNYRIHDIGYQCTDLNSVLLLNNVIQHGNLSKRNVAKILSVSEIGLISYPSEALGKSGVFAAYMAYHLCAIVISKKYLERDGLVPGVHYLQAFPNNTKKKRLMNEIKKNGWLWYQDHNVKFHIKAFKELYV
jgi:hypothetical protein